MACLLYIFLPTMLGLTGLLLHPAIAAAHFYSASGWQRGKRIGRFAAPGLFFGTLLLIVTGARGSAGSGITIWGSESVIDPLMGVALYTPITLAVFAGVLYVVRDLTLGHIGSTAKGNS
jgi:hypothetical protein